MKQFSYRERDYAFGQSMLALRTAIGLTQAGLAEHLGASRRAAGAWEVGSSYPKAHYLQHVMTLAMQQQAFPPDGRPRRSGRCSKRPVRRCSSMSSGSPPCWA